MEMKKVEIKDIDQYIAGFPPSTQKLLQQVRTTIQKAAPKAEEIISYSMPAFKFHGGLVYFAGCKNHIGFYPMASGIANFQKEIAAYRNAKGSVQFPLDKPMPVKLITQIVKFRALENIEKAEFKKLKKKK